MKPYCAGLTEFSIGIACNVSPLMIIPKTLCKDDARPITESYGRFFKSRLIIAALQSEETENARFANNAARF